MKGYIIIKATEKGVEHEVKFDKVTESQIGLIFAHLEMIKNNLVEQYLKNFGMIREKE